MKTTYCVLLCALINMLIVGKVAADSYVVKPPEEVIKEAPIIIYAQVSSVSFHTTQNIPGRTTSSGYAVIELSTLKALKGDPPLKLQLRRASTTPDGFFLDSEYRPTYRVGDKVIICIEPKGDDLYTQIGLYSGIYYISNGKVVGSDMDYEELVREIIEINAGDRSNLSDNLPTFKDKSRLHSDGYGKATTILHDNVGCEDSVELPRYSGQFRA